MIIYVNDYDVGIEALPTPTITLLLLLLLSSDFDIYQLAFGIYHFVFGSFRYIPQADDTNPNLTLILTLFSCFTLFSSTVL